MLLPSLKRCVCLSAIYPLLLFRLRAAFANNHWQGQAVDTARQLKMLLGG
jgi:hypothetical protein